MAKNFESPRKKTTLKEALIARAGRFGVHLDVLDGWWVFVRQGDRMCIASERSHAKALDFWRGYEAGVLYPPRVIDDDVKRLVKP